MNKSNFFNIARATSTITVDGIDGDVHCRELSAGAVALLQKESNEMSVLAQVLLGGVTDDKGKALFTGADKGKILDMPMKPLQAIAEEILKLTGLDAAATDEDDESPNE